MVKEPLKNLLLYVFLQGVNQVLINVDNEKAVDHILENLVHKGLEDGGGSHKAVGQDLVFIVPLSGDKGRLSFAVFTYYTVICTSQVGFRIDVGVAHLFKGRWVQKKKETVLDRDVIQ
jgi:hypothetical protein